MLQRHSDNRMQIEMVSTEEPVPSNHLLRKIDAAVDFNQILDLVSEYYDAETGRPSADPVVLFKLARRKKAGTIAKPTTDPDSGLFVKGEHQKCFVYEANTACDKNNVVPAVEVTPGNVHDSVSFDPLKETMGRVLSCFFRGFHYEIMKSELDSQPV